MRGFDSAHNHRLHAASVKENFLPISNARVADYCRRSEVVPSCLPGCRPVSGPGFSAMRGSMAIARVDEDKEEVRPCMSCQVSTCLSVSPGQKFVSPSREASIWQQTSARDVPAAGPNVEERQDKNEHRRLPSILPTLRSQQRRVADLSLPRRAGQPPAGSERVRAQEGPQGVLEQKVPPTAEGVLAACERREGGNLAYRYLPFSRFRPLIAAAEPLRTLEAPGQNDDALQQSGREEEEIAESRMGEEARDENRTMEGSPLVPDEDMEGDWSKTNLASYSLASRNLKMSALEEQIAQLELQIADATNSIKPGRLADIGLTVDTILEGVEDPEEVWTASRLSLAHANFGKSALLQGKSRTPDLRVNEEASGTIARMSTIRRTDSANSLSGTIEEHADAPSHDSFRRRDRFLGDGDEDSAPSPMNDMTIEILETLKTSNEMCERTIHDFCENKDYAQCL
eukprot:748448-Hanusia_phi.AAC.1